MLGRWWKFNAVGVAGFALQLGALWFFAQACGLQYLLATMLAVEIALLPNFLWHRAWTLRGLGVGGRGGRLVPVRLANGFLSHLSQLLVPLDFEEGFVL